MNAIYQTRSVLAGAYKSRKSLTSTLTHKVEVDEQGTEIRVVCGRVELDHISDVWSGDANAAPTCPRCLKHKG